ncbi:unspecified product [Leishmania tarentolae]|uniref:Unspecified product n=1 Tax=Leishmania tarentolae TaxID=5689 RepID=A0A640KXJ3_LEITA|nr:unspecified product [Leishmania tarentolae]
MWTAPSLLTPRCHLGHTSSDTQTSVRIHAYTPPLTSPLL